MDFRMGFGEVDNDLATRGVAGKGVTQALYLTRISAG
jgi:hypothetical protein